MKFIGILICCGLICMAGCTQSQKTGPVKEVSLTGVNMQQAMDISEDVLRDFNFTIAKEDVNSGYIRTRPLTGGQFFEFWRKDNADSRDVLESSIQDIRRTAQIKINEADSKLAVNCVVKVQRLYLPQVSAKNAGLRFDRITGQQIRTTTLSLDIDTKTITWIDLPDDIKLSSAILKKIEKKR
jgi:hypothetical protein